MMSLTELRAFRKSLRVGSGPGLGHKKLSETERALLGADILQRRTILRLQLVAAAVGCSAAFLAAAVVLTPELREAVERGERQLIPPRGAPATAGVIKQSDAA
jgi:hypothetical protein